MKPGDLVYVPAQITLMEFDESVKDIDPGQTYIGPSPVRFHKLEKPANLLLLEAAPEQGGGNDSWLSVLYHGEKFYVNKHDVLPYQEDRWLD